MKKKTLLITYRLLAIVAVAAMFTACKKEAGSVNNKNTKTITLYTPVYGSKATALASINGDANKAVTHAGKIYIKDNYIYLNELNKGIHIIDNSNAMHPVQIAFLSIPGNLDIAIKGNTLYADMYSDLLALDISNPRRAVITKKLDNFFTGRSYVNGTSVMFEDKIVTEWLERDTVVEESNYPQCMWCEFDGVLTANAAGVKSTGTAGSMAGMVLMNDHLYAITEMHNLGIVNISNAASPTLVKNDIFAGYDLQTIYPFQGKLFLGSAVGMFMYDVTDPANPQQLGTFTHGRACDPVIADEDHAYVTLHAGDGCGGEANELHVIDINDLMNPSLIRTYQLTKPTGLSKDGNLLFVCDETEVKVYNAANPANLQLLKKINSNKPYDVITFGNRAMVVCENGLYQYDYSNINSIRQLSFFAAKK
ncbi:MAG: hypothetical protein V4685_03205 [Bacteroidota bacterium]